MLIYKTLFEVKLLHEFFLTNADGSSIFDSSDPQSRSDFLMNGFLADRESIGRDLEFEFPEEFKAKYDGYFLKLLPSYSGCRVMIRVQQRSLPDHSVVFEPFVPLADGFEIFIVIIKKNNLPDVYTNSRVGRALPFLYCFSNENLSAPKIYPFMVNPIPPDKTGYSYEQGELALDNTNKIQQYYYDQNGTPATDEIKTKVTAFVNENDRFLLPLKFNYLFDNNAGITQIEFIVKDKSSNVIKSIVTHPNQPIQQLALDFSDKKDLLAFNGNLSLSENIFSLELNGDNGFSEKYQIIFSDILYNRANWGIMHIRNKVSNSAFNLLKNDGFLIRRKSSGGVWEEAPVFEIHIKSRLGHFRYSNNMGKELDLIPDLQNYLFKEGKMLIAQRPKSITESYFLLKDNGNSTKYLPNPVSYDLKKDNMSRICFDVVVPQSDLFPVI